MNTLLRTFLIISLFSSHIHLTAKPRKLSYEDSSLYWELGYEGMLYWGGPKLAKKLERKEGTGIERMPWQSFDNGMRKVFHPYDYSGGVLAKEEHWNQNASYLSKGLIYTTLATPFYLFEKDEWLGSYMTIIHCIETSFHTSRLLRSLVGRYRPRVMYRDPPSYDDGRRNSFPSGHAGEAFAWASTAVLVFDLGLYGKIAAFGAASLASLGRLPGGQHYFSDLLGGAAVGTLVPWGVYSYFHQDDETESSIENTKITPTRFSIGPNFVKVTYNF